MTTVRFKAPDDLMDELEGIEDRLGNVAVPLTVIAKLFADEMRGNIETGGHGSWLPLTASTRERHDSNLGTDTGATLGSIGILVRDTIAGADATTKGAIFMHTGRGRDWRRGFSKSKKSKKTGRRRALTKKARGGFGDRISGTEMPVREFALVSEATSERAEQILLEYVFSRRGV